MTAQGYDIQFGSNVLGERCRNFTTYEHCVVLTHASPGHFYLTKLLLPVLTATAKASPGTVRVVNMSSIVHYMGAREGIRWSTINNGDDAPAARKKLGMARLFGQSRLVSPRFPCYMARDLNHCLKGNILFSNELARRYGGDGIVSISLFPGAINADLSGYATSFLTRVRRLVGACICFIISAGDLEALTEEMRPRADTTSRPSTTQNAGLADAQDRLSELSNASLRAVTSLYAGTDPDAGQLNGKVRYPILRNCT